MNSVLVVEDEPMTQRLITANLERAGHKVRGVTSVAEAQAFIREALPDVIVLDWILPNTSGVTLIRQLRTDQRTRNVPIIMLTGRSQEIDKVTGLEAGADDYVTKPFGAAELVARIKAVIRRRSPLLAEEVVEIDGLRLDPAALRITGGGQFIELGATEFRMLHFFMTHPNRVYSRSQLLDAVWGDNVFVEERTVDVHIRRLRQTLEPAGYGEYIETVRGVGYCFRRIIASSEEAGLDKAAPIQQ